MAYSAIADLQAVFGEEFVTDWADKNLDGTADTGAVNYAIAAADAYIDARLRRGRYAIPFGSAPTPIVSLSARLAGLHLYEHWGLGSDRAERMTQVRQQCETELEMILDGRMLLDATEV
jgi:phage gp36-like protein